MGKGAESSIVTIRNEANLHKKLRVSTHGKAAIVVVGSSSMRGQDTEIHSCLSDIGRSISFEVPKIGFAAWLE